MQKPMTKTMHINIRTESEAYLETESTKIMAVSANRDLELEKKLGKKIEDEGLLLGVDLLERTASLTVTENFKDDSDSVEAVNSKMQRMGLHLIQKRIQQTDPP